jgi:hypothetical protein
MAHVVLNGQEFELRPEPPKAGRLMVIARAEKRGDSALMAAYLDFLESMLAEGHDTEAFEQAISEMDFDEIKSALENAAKSYQADPTSAGRESSPHSGGGQPTGERTSRVVSFSQAAG